MIKRVAWRLQALIEGDPSERARRRAAELANDADLRLAPPRPTGAMAPEAEPDPAPPRRLAPGAALSRLYKGRRLNVLVLNQGFEFEGRVFKSLSAVAKTVTGSHCNG